MIEGVLHHENSSAQVKVTKAARTSYELQHQPEGFPSLQAAEQRPVPDAETTTKPREHRGQACLSFG